MQLFIGNKNYSSWSMRPWVLMRHFEIPFDEVMVRFDDFERRLDLQAAHRAGGADRARAGAGRRRPGGVGHAGDRGIPGRALASTCRCGRAMRAIAPVHAACARRCMPGFRRCAAPARRTSRRRCPRSARRVLQEQAAVRSDLQRLQAMWREALQRQRRPVPVRAPSASSTPTSRRWPAASAPTRCRVDAGAAGLCRARVRQPRRGGMGSRGAGRARIPRLRGALSHVARRLNCLPYAWALARRARAAALQCGVARSADASAVHGRMRP